MLQAVRDALGILCGDQVLFRVEGSRAVLTRLPDFLTLAGYIPVAADQGSATWDDVLRNSRARRAVNRR